MQQFISEGIFKKFDYMSTVSGGGYMGACLSSVMNTDPEKFVHPDLEEEGDQENTSEEEGVSRIPGMDQNTSPFVLLQERMKQEPDQKASVESSEETEEEPDPEKRVKSKSIIPGQFNIKIKEKEGEESLNDPEKEDKRPTLNLDLRYKTARKTKLDARHQLHHLRMFGEYLTPDKSFFSTDVQRAIGTIFAGIVHNILLFALALTVLVCFNYLLFDKVSERHFFWSMEFPQYINDSIDYARADHIADSINNANLKIPEVGEGEAQSPEQADSFWSDHLGVYFSKMFEVAGKHWQFVISIFGLGLLVSLYFEGRINGYIRKIQQVKKQIQTHEKEVPGPSGSNIESHYEKIFAGYFRITTILGALVFMGVAMGIGYGFDIFEPDEYDNYWLIFVLPTCYALGVFSGVYTWSALAGDNYKQRRLSRAFHGDLRGISFIGVLISFSGSSWAAGVICLQFLSGRILLYRCFECFFCGLYRSWISGSCGQSEKQ